MEKICLVTYMYICFMATRPDYMKYQLEESEMILGILHPPLYIITKGIPWIA